jgi:hypothetical protein
MPGAALQNVGLIAGWVLGEEPWGDEMNANLRALDALIQGRVLDKDLTAPPGAPAAGDAYIVGAAATGDWATHDGKIARYSGTAWEFYTPKAGWAVYVVDESVQYLYTTAWKKFNALFYEKQLACSDYNSTALSAGEVGGFRAACAFRLEEVRVSLKTAQDDGSLLTVDVKVNGVSVFTTLLTVDNDETTSEGATTPYVFDGVINIADDDAVVIEITQVGDGTAKGMVATLIGSRTLV